MADGTLGLSRLPVGAIERRGVGWWGMICVIATEGAVFSYLLFSYYYDVRFGEAWRPSELPSFRLSLPNTIILLLSNLAARAGARGLKRGARGELIAGIAVALILGIAFVVLQAIEWRQKSFSVSSSTYSSMYFTVSGLHMAHLATGVLILLMVLIWSALGYFDRWRNAPVLIGNAYWHFVLVVWLAVFLTFYIAPYWG
jgi:heme/copper-type cytochrome/quinol oxidase subunit 3